MTIAVPTGIQAMRNLLTALLLLALPALALAAEDPPGRVARLSHIEGEVSVAPAGTQEWGDAVLNRPLTSEDRIWVDRNGRAELQIDSTIVHLDETTDFAFLDLDDDAITMSLAEGRATVRVLRKREREVIDIDTPNANVTLLHPGEYHIEVDPDGEVTVVKARSGEAEVTGEGEKFLVRANEMGTFRGTEALQGDISRLGPRTAFENWANERARRSERSISSRYVGEGVIGYEDLDAHGHWAHEPEYGYVWYPRYVVSGWAPYRFGRWVWVSPWGWTWIDDARWGFAPFHYGRWAYVRHRWCWVPGPRHVRAVYAPALVAWVGAPHVSVSVSLGHGIGWFPLAPHEVYVPGYWHSHRYLRRVNISNTIIVNHIHIDRAYRGRYHDFVYRYRDRPHAVTVVEREHFVRGRPVGRHLTNVSDRDLRNWRFDARPPAIAPHRESILAGEPRAIRVSNQAAGNRLQATGEAHRAARRVSFDAERRAIEANGGRPVARTQLIERNPKEGAGIRIPRGRVTDDVRASGHRNSQLQRMPARENDRGAGRVERRSSESSGEVRPPKTYSVRPNSSSSPPVRSLTPRDSVRAEPRVREHVREPSRVIREMPRSQPQPRSVAPRSAPRPSAQPQVERRSTPAPAQRSPSMRSSERPSHASSGRVGNRAGSVRER